MAVSSMSTAASQAQNLCEGLWGAGAGGLGNCRRARMITVGQRRTEVTAKHKWMYNAVRTCAEAWPPICSGRPVFPAVDSDVDFEENHGGEQDDAENHLDPLVKLITVAILDLGDAPAEHQHDGEHGEEQEIEHQRCTSAEEAVDAGIRRSLHDDDLNRFSDLAGERREQEERGLLSGMGKGDCGFRITDRFQSEIRNPQSEIERPSGGMADATDLKSVGE